MRHRIFFAVAFVAVALSGVDAHAESGFPGGRRWAIGFGAVASPSPFVDHRTRVWPVPVVVYLGERFRAMGPDLNYSVVSTPMLRLDLAAGTRFEGFEPGASSGLAGMGERRLAFEMGFHVDARRFSLDYRADVAGTHGGHQLRLAHTRPIELHFGALLPSVSATWKSGDLTNYYYGVRESEATASRQAYQPSGTVVFSAGIELVRQLNWNWMLMGSVTHEFLPGAVRNSPIVEDHGQTSLSIVLMRIL